MAEEAKYPARLDIVDMPRDPERSLGNLRQNLCASFNYCRQYPRKMAVLKATVKFLYTRIVEWEKQNEALQAAIVAQKEAAKEPPVSVAEAVKAKAE